MHCKSLWIKVSAKCINVNVNQVNLARIFHIEPSSRQSYLHCLYTQDMNSQTPSVDPLKAYVNCFAGLKAFLVLTALSTD